MKVKLHASKPSRALYIIHSIIGISLMLFGRFIPPFGFMTPIGMTVLGIFVGLIYLWITVDFVWPSVFGLVILGFSVESTGGVAQVLTTTASGAVVQQILWLLVLTAIVSVSKVTDQLALRMVRSKLCKGHPWVLTTMLFIAAYVCAALCGPAAIMLLCWSMVNSICDQVGYTKKDMWPRMMLVGIGVMASVGAAIVPFHASVVGVFGYLSAASAGEYSNLSYTQYLAFAGILSPVVIALFTIACRVFLRPNVKPLAQDITLDEPEPFTLRQKVALILIAAFLVFAVVPEFLPASSIKTILLTLGVTPCITLVIAIAVALRDKQGKPLFTFDELAKEGLYWQILFLVGTAVTVGRTLATPQTGFTETALQVLDPVFGVNSALLFIVAVIVVSMITTNLLNNAVTSAILVPVYYPFAIALGVNPIMLTVMFVYVVETGLMLPSSSAAATLLYGNDRLTRKDILGIAALGSVVTGIALIICLQPAMMIFGV